MLTLLTSAKFEVLLGWNNSRILAGTYYSQNYSRIIGTGLVTVVNPRRACAARVTVVGCVCLSVCVSVKSHLTSETSNRAIKEYAYLVAYERQKICGDLPETTAFKSYAAKHERKSQYIC